MQCLLHYWKQLTSFFVNSPSYFHVGMHESPYLNNAIKWKSKTEALSSIWVHLTSETHLKTILPEPQYYIQQQNPFSHLIGWQTKGCFAVPLHIVEKSRWMGCYEATVLKNRRKRTRTRMHTIMYLMVMKALWILSRTAAQQWAMCSSSLTPVWECVCVCVCECVTPPHMALVIIMALR